MDVDVNRQKKTKPPTVQPVSQLGISRATASHKTPASIPGPISPQHTNDMRRSQAATTAFVAMLQTTAAIATRGECFKIVVSAARKRGYRGGSTAVGPVFSTRNGFANVPCAVFFFKQKTAYELDM